MKKIIIIVIFLFLWKIPVIRASSFEFKWFNTTLEIPVNAAINNYRDKPYCEVYQNGKKKDYPLFYEKGVNFTTLTTVQTAKPGIYRIFYRVSFKDENNISFNNIQEIYFQVKDFEPPEVIINDEVKIPVEKINQINSYLLKGLVVSDNYSKKEDIKITFDLKYINFRIGIFYIPSEAIDTEGNVLRFHRKVIVYDDTAPQLYLINEYLKLSVGQNYDLTKNIIALDNSMTESILSVSHNIDFTKLGIYEITYRAKDYSANITEKKGFVELIDDCAPELILTEKSGKFTKNNYFSLDFKKYILKACDNYDLLKVDDVKITLINYDEEKIVKEFTVVFTLTDLSNNETSETLKMTLENKVLPQIHFEDVILNINGIFDPLENVKAFDDFNLDISENIMIISNNLNTKKAGIYSISYYVFDAYGNDTTGIRTITVKENKEEVKKPIEDIKETPPKVEKEIGIFEKVRDFIEQNLIFIGIILAIIAFSLYKVFKKLKEE